jgi:hypothetical protein
MNEEYDMDFSNDQPTINAQLRAQNLRRAHGHEAGWYVTCVEFSIARKVWACEASEPVAKAPLQFFSYAETKGY